MQHTRVDLSQSPDQRNVQSQDGSASPFTGQHAIRAWLVAIVDSSDDAIISKSLHGIISSWNQGAQHIFGYRADEAIGHPIDIIIPADRRDEESLILARLRRGERVDHFE